MPERQVKIEWAAISKSTSFWQLTVLPKAPDRPGTTYIIMSNQWVTFL